MKPILLFMLITIAWFSIKSETFIRIFPPAGGIQEEKVLCKQVISPLEKADEKELSLIGLDKKSVNYEIYSPAFSVKEKMKRSKKNFQEIFGFDKVYSIFLDYIRRFSQKAPFLLIIISAVISFLYLIKSWASLRYTSNFLFDLSRISLFVVSIASLILAFFYRVNIWQESVLFWFPSATLVIGSAGLRLLDMNFPIWRRIFSSFVLPIISGILI